MIDTDFGEDVRIAKELGIEGLGVIESKLDDEMPASQLSLLRGAGLEATSCAARILTILPQPSGLSESARARFPGPAELDARLAAWSEGLQRLAPLHPDNVHVCTGPAGDFKPADARAAVIDGLRTMAAMAREVGTRVAVEPMRKAALVNTTILTSLQETLDLLDEVGRDDIGIVFDTYHMWDSPQVYDMLKVAADRIVDVQVGDYRQPNRGPKDRVMPGDGVADIPRLLSALRNAGYGGWYDLEVMSDDGRFGMHYPDSLWKLEPTEFARRLVDGFRRCWSAL